MNNLLSVAAAIDQINGRYVSQRDVEKVNHRICVCWENWT